MRPSHSFLNALLLSPSTLLVLFNAGRPLISIHPESSRRNLAFLSAEEATVFLGPQPFFGQLEGQTGIAADNVPALQAARHLGSAIVFLGLRESSGGEASTLPLSDFRDVGTVVANINGNAIFCVDIGGFDIQVIDDVLRNSALGKAGHTLEFVEPRTAMDSLDEFTSGIFALARSMIDWNQRNKFCPACGSPSYSLWGGWKIQCTSALPWADNGGREPCLTSRGVHNFSHPRTDPVVIVLVIDESGEKALLGRNKKFPAGWYSALAGFVEPGETFEDAVNREVWEEAGVKVREVKYHSGQPWPYPADLMVGFYATADSSQPIRTDLDNELEDARWCTREEVLSILRNADASTFQLRDLKVLPAHDKDVNAKSTATSMLAARSTADCSTQTIDKPTFKIPGPKAIAGVLIREWAEGRAMNSLAASADMIFARKGNL